MTAPPLTVDDFTPHRGEAFAVEADGGPVPLVLAEAKALSDSGREGGAFRLEFEGPLQPQLGQGIYRFRRGERADDIFIVPIARTAEAMRYEAVFF